MSGAYLHRPELNRLLSETQPNDVLLVEQIDRLTRLNNEDWATDHAKLTNQEVAKLNQFVFDYCDTQVYASSETNLSQFIKSRI